MLSHPPILAMHVLHVLWHATMHHTSKVHNFSMWSLLSLNNVTCLSCTHPHMTSQLYICCTYTIACLHIRDQQLWTCPNIRLRLRLKFSLVDSNSLPLAVTTSTLSLNLQPPPNFDLHLLIALHKSIRSCTLYLISYFVSYDHLHFAF